MYPIGTAAQKWASVYLIIYTIGKVKITLVKSTIFSGPTGLT